MPLALTYQEARTQVERLAERFARNLDAYTRPDDQTLYQRQIQATDRQIDIADGTLGAWSMNSTTSPKRRSPLSITNRPDRFDKPVRSSLLHTVSPPAQATYRRQIYTAARTFGASCTSDATCLEKRLPL